VLPRSYPVRKPSYSPLAGLAGAGPQSPAQSLLLLDRDGTLMADTGYPDDPAAVELIPGAAGAVRELARRGFAPVVVSNQSGLGRGLIAPAAAAAVHARFVLLFAEASGTVLPCYYCPHAPEAGCECRKPRAGLLRRAAANAGLCGARAVMVGDKPSDVEAGREFGAATVWLSGARPWLSARRPDVVAADWDDALDALTRLPPPLPRRLAA
jgi:D-glycero-D-manno-heptose 1,7-bisphosphate phosphatase